MQYRLSGGNDADVVNRTYDDGMRLTGTTYGNNLSESRSYRVSGSNKDNLTASIAITNVSGFSYTYDANKNKTAETDSIAAAYSWTTPSGYDDKDRLVAWTRIQRQQPELDALQGRGLEQHHGQRHPGDPHPQRRPRADRPRGSALACDVKGNLTRAAGDTADRYAWDYDNKLKSADTTQDGTADVTYAYDALGRRVSKAIGATTTVYVRP